jgi:hypothetical protein
MRSATPMCRQRRRCRYEHRPPSSHDLPVIGTMRAIGSVLLRCPPAVALRLVGMALRGELDRLVRRALEPRWLWKATLWHVIAGRRLDSWFIGRLIEGGGYEDTAMLPNVTKESLRQVVPTTELGGSQWYWLQLPRFPDRSLVQRLSCWTRCGRTILIGPCRRSV